MFFEGIVEKPAPVELVSPEYDTDIKVISRDGSETPLDVTKIRKVVNWACKGLGVNPIALESSLTTRLKTGISTREIQENLIHCSLELCSPQDPNWRYVAGRLHIWGLWKDTLVNRGYQYGDYKRLVEEKLDKGMYDSRMRLYSGSDLDAANQWINPDWDIDYDYAGSVLLQKRYLLKDELPQEAFLTCALLLASVEKPEDRLPQAKRFYEAIAKRKLSLATPILANLRVPGGSLSSCFITAMDDDLESIFGAIHDAARISKSGGGVGVNLSRIRATGSWVRGKANTSGGVVPWIKLLNDTAIAVNQGGKRAGAITTSIDVWHLDVPEFLEMQTENGDQRRKAYDVFPQLVIPDEFMRRVTANTDWTLVDPYEVRTKLGIELAELWGDAFENAYAEIESHVGGLITLYKKVGARHLFKEAMRTQLETGMPYMWFKDTVNRANPNQHQGYIPSGNLCVAPETYILTDKGQYQIADLEGQFVNVWNGSEWSNVLVRKTGENQPLLKVKLSNGESLECTYYHHFWVQDTYRSQPRRVEAKDLKQGDKLIKYQLPVVQSESDVDFPYAYTAGFFSGDGSVGAGNFPEIDLYGPKKELLPHLAVRNHLRGSQWGTKELSTVAVYHDEKQDRIVCKLPLDIPKRFTVPLNGYTVASRIEWLAGLLDSDGSVYRNGTNEAVVISSIHKEFLLEVRLMLQTLGVDSKVSKTADGGFRPLPDKKGGVKDYFCQTAYRLLISSNGLFALGELGLKTYRLSWTHRKPQREATHFIKVEDVELTCRRDNTFCFTEPLRNLGMFNGILTGQCQESYSNVKPGSQAHCCNLVSINLANVEDSEIEEISDISVRLLDNTIELTVTPFEASRYHNEIYRTIGVGAMGLADWLAKRKMGYKHLRQISDLFEDIAYHCTRTSMELSKERGAYPAFPGSEWSKGNLVGAKPVEWFIENASKPSRWVELSEDVKQYGIRNSHITAIAPNTSSSLVQGCTASVLPIYSKFFYEKGGAGAVPIAPPYLKESFWYYAENKALDQKKVIEAISTIQQWIDTGISMELLFNLNAGVYFPEDPERSLSAKEIFETLLFAWEKGCKAIYYVRTVQKDDFKDSEDGCVSCAN